MSDWANNSSLEPNGTHETSVRTFYKDTTIFISGATGFLGKMLVFRILKTCQVKEVIILLRARRGKPFESRFEEYLKSEIFSHLPDPRVLRKVVPLEGDVSFPALGLNEADVQLLLERVNVVFHCAAVLNFTAPIKRSVRITLSGTSEMLKLCKRMAGLEVLVYTSSHSAWFVHQRLEERIRHLPQNINPLTFIDEIRSMDEAQAAIKEAELVGHFPKYPNTYTLTKSMAEALLYENRGHVKVVIIRPPFLFSALKDPAPGWSDATQTAADIFNYYAQGILRTLCLDPETKLNQLPVDLCANAALTTAWFMSSQSPVGFRIFNITCYQTGHITLRDYTRIAAEMGHKFPSIEQMRPPNGGLERKESLLFYRLHWFVSSNLYAYLVDSLLLVSGRKPRVTQMYSRLRKYFDEVTVKLFKHELPADSQNITNLYHEQGPISEVERNIFYYNVEDIDWRELLVDHYMRRRRFVLNEQDSNIPQAVRRMKVVSFSYVVIQCVFWSSLLLIPTVLYSYFGPA